MCFFVKSKRNDYITSNKLISIAKIEFSRQINPAKEKDFEYKEYIIECIFLSQGRHYDSFPDFTPSSDANWSLTDSQH